MNITKLLPGNQLSKSDQAYVLAAYVHRYTGTHKPMWAYGTNYPVQFADDADWLAHSLFVVRATSLSCVRLAHVECQSSPTWPLNPELRK